MISTGERKQSPSYHRVQVSLTAIQTCPHCRTRVFARSDGSCPACLVNLTVGPIPLPALPALPKERHPLALVGIVLGSLAVAFNAPGVWLFVGCVSATLGYLAESEVQATKPQRGLRLTHASIALGALLITLSAASFATAILGTNSGMVYLRTWAGSLSWLTAAVALALKALNRILNESHKQRITDALLRAWNWLDDQKQAVYPALLWHDRPQQSMLWLSATVYLLIQALSIFPLYERLALDSDLSLTPSMWGFLILASAPFVALGAWVARSAYRREHLAVMGRVKGSQTLNDYFTTLIAASFTYAPYLMLPVLGASLRELNLPLSVRVFLLGPLAILSVLPVVLRRNAEAFLLLVTFALSVVFLILTTWARLALHVTERVVASVLENKDGVVMGAVAILIALGALVRLLQ